MSLDTDLLTEIRDLLQIMAEPQIAERDKRLRTRLIEIVGTSKRMQDAVLRMTGSNTRQAIIAEAKIDQAQLSRLIKTLTESGLIE